MEGSEIEILDDADDSPPVAQEAAFERKGASDRIRPTEKTGRGLIDNEMELAGRPIGRPEVPPGRNLQTERIDKIRIDGEPAEIIVPVRVFPFPDEGLVASITAGTEI